MKVKKFAARLLAAVMAASLFACGDSGSGGGGGSGGGDKKITFWSVFIPFCGGSSTP